MTQFRHLTARQWRRLGIIGAMQNGDTIRLLFSDGRPDDVWRKVPPDYPQDEATLRTIFGEVASFDGELYIRVSEETPS